MYRVIEYFTDLHDDDHEYREGDVFPREGIKVSKERLEELASDKNLRGTPGDRTGKRTREVGGSRCSKI